MKNINNRLNRAIDDRRRARQQGLLYQFSWVDHGLTNEVCGC